MATSFWMSSAICTVGSTLDVQLSPSEMWLVLLRIMIEVVACGREQEAIYT